jgi:hypothetical protein
MRIDMAKKENNLENLLAKSSVNICQKWQEIKDNDQEINYKKDHIDPKYEYFSAKKALIQSDDQAVSNWATNYEYNQLNSKEFGSKIHSVFTANQLQELISLSQKAARTETPDGGYSYIMDNTQMSINEIITYQNYQQKLETLQCDLWEEPYQILAGHCIGGVEIL